MAELFLEHSEHQCADPQAFKEDVDSLVQAARETTVSLSQVSDNTNTTITIIMSSSFIVQSIVFRIQMSEVLFNIFNLYL